jgi:hypothetical protein
MADHATCGGGIIDLDQAPLLSRPVPVDGRPDPLRRHQCRRAESAAGLALSDGSIDSGQSISVRLVHNEPVPTTY